MGSIISKTVPRTASGLGNVASRRSSSQASTATETNFVKKEEVYPIGLRWLHWIMAVGVLTTFGLVKAAQNTKDLTKKGNLMWYHKSTGLLVLGLLFPRLFIRVSSKLPAEVEGSYIEKFLAKFSHNLLYFFMAFMGASGVIMGYYGGKGLPFFWTHIPGIAQPRVNISKPAYEYHKQFGQIFEFLVAIHVSAVGYHHLIKGQPILRRINPLK